MNPEVRYYLSIFVRRFPLFLLVAVTISSAAAAIAVILPTVYTANARILVESAQIPGELAQSTVATNTQTQLSVVQQRLTTRSNLLEIARDYNVYEDQVLLNPDQIVARMRSDMSLRSRGGRDQATVMEVRFSARSGEIAASVANELVTRILADNARTRMRQAEDTLAFFEQEVDRLNTELELQSVRILEFQNANADALPASLTFRQERQALLQERAARLDREIASLEDRRASLIQVFEDTGGVPQQAETQLSPAEQRLVALEQELEDALTIYSESNPRVRILVARIDALKSRIAATDLPTADANEQSTEEQGALRMLDLQLAEIDSQIESYDEELIGIEAELIQLEDALRRTPNNEIELSNLERDYANIQAQYNAAVDRLAAAATGEQIETLGKAERISVIENAIPPTAPSSPNRPLIAVGGLGLGLSSGLGLLLVLELLNRSVRRPVDITRGLGITPLATIPYIATSGERLRRRFVFLSVFALVLAGIPAGLYFIHYSVMPLDLLADRILDKLPF